eukprot:COSAG01_NODE_14915_length_1395_cov_169.659722_1_plen_151_part_00
MYVGGMLACNIVCVTLLYVLRCTFFNRSESISYDLYSCRQIQILLSCHEDETSEAGWVDVVPRRPWGAGVQVEALRVLQRATVQLGLLSGPTTPTHRRSAWLDAATVVAAPAQGWSPASHVVPTMSAGDREPVHWWDDALPAGWLPLHVR